MSEPETLNSMYMYTKHISILKIIVIRILYWIQQLEIKLLNPRFVLSHNGNNYVLYELNKDYTEVHYPNKGTISKGSLDIRKNIRSSIFYTKEQATKHMKENLI